MTKTDDTKRAAAHTPEPWHTEPLQWDHGASIAICSKQQGVLAIIPPLNDAENAATAQRDPDDIANGELMAAAPLLLEALQYALEFLEANDDGEQDVTSRINKARVALVAARAG
jgi:hypothetical protein